MKLSIWLPDSLASWAKSEGVNLSATLTQAVEALRQEQPGEEVAPGVVYAGDDVVVAVEEAEGVETSAPRVRLKVATLRHWLARIDKLDAKNKPKR